MSELRAGGMAIIINGVLKKNVGKTVILRRYLGVIKGFVYQFEKPAWEVESASGEIMKGILPGGYVVDTNVLSVPSDWLMPIDGENFSHEDERQEELVNG